MFKILLIGAFIFSVSGRPQEGTNLNQTSNSGPKVENLSFVSTPTVEHLSLASGPPPKTGNSSIVKSEFVDSGNGNFNWDFETSDGIKAEQTGQTASPGTGRNLDSNSTEEHGGEIIKGSYSYTAPNGQLISLTYVADEHGFQPVGSHLPTPPPNPFGASSKSPAAQTPNNTPPQFS